MKYKISFSLLLGHFFEQYDKALYTLLAPVLAPLFFQNQTPLMALIYTYSILPLGFLVRPLGALYFGRLGDRQGKKIALSTTLWGMSLVTISMGIIPLNPTLLILGRLLQSFFAAGETTGASLLLLENTPYKKRSFFSSIFDFSGILGILLASLLATTFIHLKVIDSLWRALFIFGGFTGFVGLYIRKYLPDDIQSNNPPFTLKQISIAPVLKIACLTGPLPYNLYVWFYLFK